MQAVKDYAVMIRVLLMMVMITVTIMISCVVRRTKSQQQQNCSFSALPRFINSHVDGIQISIDYNH